MKLKYKKILPIFISITCCVLPICYLAAATSLTNPINQTNPLVIISYIIRALLGLLGAVTVLMFVYGGFMLVFSTGNEERLKKGRSTLIWAIIGMAIVLSSYSILSYLFKILASSSGAD